MMYKSRPICRMSLHRMFPVFIAVTRGVEDNYTKTTTTRLGPCVSHYTNALSSSNTCFGVVKKAEFRDIDLSFVATYEVNGSWFPSPRTYYVASSDEEVLMNFMMKYF